MNRRYATVSELRRGISTEILVAAGWPREGWPQPALAPLVWPVAQRFASLAAGFDRRTAQLGLKAAAQWVLPRFVDGVTLLGAEQLPAEGPLVIASNHPGSYDSLAIIASLPRDDVKIIVSDVPFLRGMHATAEQLIYTSHDPHDRMGAAREGIRHLQAGGTLLVFASAQVDPDPALLPGAVEALQAWSSSLPLFLRRVPQARLVTTIVSGVLAPACFYHPLARTRPEQRMQQFLAEFLQVGQQVLFGRRFHLTPTVRFAAPLAAADLADVRDTQAVMGVILRRAEKLLASVTSGA